jgi:hypothetical protein
MVTVRLPRPQNTDCVKARRVADTKARVTAKRPTRGSGTPTAELREGLSDQTRSGLSPNTMRISAAVSTPMPNPSRSVGDCAVVSPSRTRSWTLISASSADQRLARARSAIEEPASTDRAAASASRLSVLPFARRCRRSPLLTLMIRCPARRRKLASPTP